MRIEPAPKLTPKGPGHFMAASQDGDVKWREAGQFSWEALVASVLHPAKVAIIEGLTWIEQPLSARQLEELFRGSSLYLGIISYHLKGLNGLGVLEVVGTEPVRGATEKFYFFHDPGETGGPGSRVPDSHTER